MNQLSPKVRRCFIYLQKNGAIKGTSTRNPEILGVLACDVSVDHSTRGHQLSNEELSVVIFIGAAVIRRR